MAVMITDDCINCGACASECPADAIYEPGENYQVNKIVYPALSNDHFYIVSNLCNQCSGFNIVKCISICPMDTIKNY